MSATVVDKIFESIHEDIISFALKPGQRLHIADLADFYQVGTGPVREALLRLLSSGLVILISQRGFRVTPVSKQDLYDIYQTRSHIEALCLRLAMQKGTDAWEAAIVGTYHQLAKFESAHKLTTTADYKEWEILHRAFNHALISACGLSHLLDIQARLYQLSERYRRQWLMAGVERIDGLPYAKEQRKIMDAVLARNEDLAIRLLFKHFESATEVIFSTVISTNNSIK